MILLALDFAFRPLIPPELAAAPLPPFLTGLVSSFYGGISEEILIRFGLMAFVAWLLFAIGRKREAPSAAVMWTAILVAAIVFGIGHLPATALLAPLTPAVVLRALVLNGVPGIVFGYLFWKRGLEAAMLSHFSLDVVIHGIAPLILA